MKGWPLVFALGFGKVFAKVAALFVVPFLDDSQRNDHPIFGARDATDLSWKNIAFRNGAHNLYSRPMPNYEDIGGRDRGDPTLEKVKGLQTRLRRSVDGKYVSYRATWGKVSHEGKAEFYVGWVMNEKAEYMRLTFFQFRPVYLLVIALGWLGMAIAWLGRWAGLWS